MDPFTISLIVGGALGLFGGGLSLFSGWNRAQEEQAEIAAQKEAERKMREAQIREQKAAAERDIALAQVHFKIEQEDAFRKSDDIWKQGERIDERSDLEETLTGRAFNLAVTRDKIADDNALHTEQRGKQNFAQKQGQMKTALGLSGTRAGTNSAESLLSQNAQNFEQDVSLMQNQRKAEREISLMGTWASLRSGMQRIDEQRDMANTAFRDSKQLRDDYTGTLDNRNINDEISAIEKEYAEKIKSVKFSPFFMGVSAIGRNTRDPFKAITELNSEKEAKIAELKKSYAQSAATGGGRAVNLFNQKMVNRRFDLQGSIDLQNLGGHFKQAALNRAYDRAEYTFLDGLTNFAGGFNSGFSTGTSIANFAQSWGNFGASPSTANYRASVEREMFSPFGNAGVRRGDGLYDIRKIRNPMGLPF